MEEDLPKMGFGLTKISEELPEMEKMKAIQKWKL